MTGWLVVTDVDHTLLEHAGEEALAGECLRHLHRQGVATLLASSKTFGEMAALHAAAGLTPQPFLFENGAGVGWPLERWPAAPPLVPRARHGAYGAIVAGPAPERLASLLTAVRAGTGLRFMLLGELSAAEVGRRLGLTEDRARLALDRMASLPLVWDDGDELELLRRQLHVHGLEAVRGGRLVHVAAPGGKAEALRRLDSWLADGGREPVGPAATRAVLACGDSENDRGLLEHAAIALVFHPQDAPPLELAAPAPGREPWRRSVPAGGPRAWLEAVEAALAAAGPVPR